MITTINRILFDYDGTLIIHDKENEGRQVAKLLGIHEDQIPEFEGRLAVYFEKYYVVNDCKMTYDIYLRNLDAAIWPYEVFGVTARQLDEAIRENSKVSTKLASNAEETLEYLASKGYQICLFTNGFYDAQTDNMKYKGIFEYFDKIYAWDDFYTKPDRRAFIRALSGTNPKHNVMIGDSLTADIAPAKAMGIYSVGINVGNAHESAIKPDLLISDLSELRTIL